MWIGQDAFYENSLSYFRFPLNGYCKVTTMQVKHLHNCDNHLDHVFYEILIFLSFYRHMVPLITQVIGTLLNAQFELKTSNGGGVEGQQFSEYLFLRHSLPL